MSRWSPPPAAAPVARRSLVTKLVASFLAPVLAILLVVALLAYRRSVAGLEQSVLNRLEAVATVKQVALDAWIERLREDARVMARLPPVREAATALLTGSDRTGAAYRSLAAVLGEVAAARPSVSELLLLSTASGEVLLSTRPQNEGQHRAYDLVYTEGGVRPFIQDVHSSAANLSPTLTIAEPVGGPGGTALGLLAAHHSLEFLDRSILGSEGLGDSGRVTLVDRLGLPVSGRRYARRPGGGRTLRSEGIDRLVAGLSGHADYPDPEGRRVIGVYRWIDEHEMGLLVEVARNVALAPARRQATVVISLALALVPLFASGIYLVARRIAAPIRQLAEVSRRVAGGDLRSRAEATSDDEIGVLAANFNEMVVRLEEFYDGMAHQIRDLELNERERERLIDELETKNAELERFTYTVSHDLKSPLVTIRGYVGMIERDLEEGSTERIRADLRRVSEAAGTMTDLLSQLLELSRVGRLVGPSEAVALDRVIDEAIDSVRGRQREIGAEIRIADRLPVVHGDRIRLREVFENLLDNALKFMGDQREPRVEVGLRGRRADEVEIYVRDNGSGIDPRYHDKIFGLFDRLDSGVEGTGIGLALVRRIVETHGGVIWVESDGPGTGSCFCLTLPLRERSAGDDGRDPFQARPEPDRRDRLGSRPGGRPALEERVDEGSQRRAFGDHQQHSDEQQRHHDRRQPPLLAHAQELPEVGEKGELSHSRVAYLTSPRPRSGRGRRAPRPAPRGRGRPSRWPARAPYGRS